MSPPGASRSSPASRWENDATRSAAVAASAAPDANRTGPTSESHTAPTAVTFGLAASRLTPSAADGP